MEIPPAVAYSTRWYVLPTRLPVHRKSATESMVLVEPTQTKVATTVLPSGGFWGLNSLPSVVPLCGGIVALNPHNAMGSPAASTANEGGEAASEQPAASTTAARNPLNLIFSLPVELTPRVERYDTTARLGGSQQSLGRAVQGASRFQRARADARRCDL